MDTHGNDVALHVPGQNIPLSLIDGERRLPAHAGVIVRLGHDPRRRIGDTEVQHETLRDEIMEAVHDFLDGAVVVPEVYVEDVDVARAKLAQGVVDGDVHRLDIVPHVCRLLRDLLEAISALVE